MAESEPVKLEVDIVSDVVCPWCIIGYRQLQKALDMLPGQFAVDIRWHPFELNPGMGELGQDVGEHLAPEVWDISRTESGGALTPYFAGRFTRF